LENWHRSHNPTRPRMAERRKRRCWTVRESKRPAKLVMLVHLFNEKTLRMWLWQCLGVPGRCRSAHPWPRCSFAWSLNRPQCRPVSSSPLAPRRLTISLAGKGQNMRGLVPVHRRPVNPVLSSSLLRTRPPVWGQSILASPDSDARLKWISG
jgi:hypothetical protein